MLEIISDLVNLLGLVLFLSMWSILENIPYELEMNFYSGFFFGCRILKLLINHITNSGFIIDFLYGRSVQWCEWSIKIPYYYCITINFSIYVCTICFVYLGASILGACMLMSVISSSYIDLFITVYCPLIYDFCSKVYFVWHEYCYPYHLVTSVYMKYLSPSFPF